MSLGYYLLQILDLSLGVGVLDNYGGHVRGQGRRLDRQIAQGYPQGAEAAVSREKEDLRRSCLDEINVLGVEVGVEEDLVPLCGTDGKGDSFGGGRRLVQERGICRWKTRQVGDLYGKVQKNKKA